MAATTFVDKQTTIFAAWLNDVDLSTYGVRHYGAVGDGVTDDTAAIQKAIDSLPATGGPLYFAGAVGYGVTTVNVNKPIAMLFAGGMQNGAPLVSLSPTGNVLNVTASGFYAKNLVITSTLTRTSGAYVDMHNTSFDIIDGFKFTNPYIGFECNGGSVNTIINGHIRNTTPSYITAGSAGLYFGRGVQGTTNVVNNVIMDTTLLQAITAGSFVVGYYYVILTAGSTNFVAIGAANNNVGTGFTATGVGAGTGTATIAAQPSYGLVLGWQDSLNVSNCSFIRSGADLAMIPATGQSNTNCYFSNTFFDSGTWGIKMQPTGQGKIARTEFINCWASSSLQYGTLIDASLVAAGGFICGTTLLNHQGNQCLNHGVYVTDANSTDTVIDGGYFAGNIFAGIFFEAACTKFCVRNVRSGASNDIGDSGGGPAGSGPNVTYGLVIGAGCSQYSIHDNNFVGNTIGPFNKLSSSATGEIYNNKGYNPVGQFGVTVGASPFTYTANNSPETLYVDGGTVSLISVGAVQMFAATGHTIDLAPNQTMQVTYTVLPTINKNIK